MPVHLVWANSIDNLSKRLIGLRGDVEQLSSELVLRRQEFKQRMVSLGSQKAELEAIIARQERSKQRLVNKIQSKRELADTVELNQETLKPVLLRALNQLEIQIEMGLPFKKQARISNVAHLRQQLLTNVVSPTRIVSRLWGFHEDELRLTQENGLYRQTILLEDELILVDVVRLGMMRLFFIAPNERYGVAVNRHGKWHFQLLENEEDKQHISYLFDSLRKQIRTGFFTIPNPL